MKFIRVLCTILFTVLFAGTALACQEYFNNDDPVVIRDYISNPAGEEASCNITTYRNSTIFDSGIMNQSALIRNYTLGILEEAQYESIIFCNTSKHINFTGSCFFKVIDVEPDDDIGIVKTNQATIDDKIDFLNDTANDIQNDTNWTVGYFQDETSSKGFWEILITFLSGGYAF